LKNKTVKIDRDAVPQPAVPLALISKDAFPVRDQEKFERWKKTNAFEQRQENYFAVTLKIQTGDISTSRARLVAELVKRFAADEIRITITQNLMLKYVHRENLPALFS